MLRRLVQIQGLPLVLASKSWCLSTASAVSKILSEKGLLKDSSVDLILFIKVKLKIKAVQYLDPYQIVKRSELATELSASSLSEPLSICFSL